MHECSSPHKVSEIYVHSGCDGCKEANDLAVIALTNPVLTDEGYPVCLPEENEHLPLRMIGAGSGGDRRLIFVK
ncbi:hypothetical protein OESDEN_18292 [Oesophagostomum dentatum]|uniref:Uncharacterized protein n=1 Tax=Oesophagostomum dentatum TaxID=61180 RepID=A0A0B1SEQ7_OESDE|nr:hypothetical protein OESDEN_18292 [Oesophagostomum dentatum]